MLVRHRHANSDFLRRSVSAGRPRRWRAPEMLADDRGRQAEDVLRDLRLPVGEEERDAAVERVDHAPSIADDRVVDLPADRVLDVRDPDAERRIRAVEDEPDLAGP